MKRGDTETVDTLNITGSVASTYLQALTNSSTTGLGIKVSLDQTSTLRKAVEVENGYVLINNTGSRDPMITFSIAAGGTFSLGLDNSDSDKFKISASATLGTTDVVTVTSTGVGIGVSPTNTLDVAGSMSVDKDQDAATTISVTNENVSTGAYAEFKLKNDLAGGSIYAHSSARTATIYGVTVGGYVELRSGTTSSGLLIGTGSAATPIIFGTNSSTRLTITSAGVINIGAGGVLQHNGTPILDASLNMTNLASLTVDKDQDAATPFIIYNENATAAAYAQIAIKAQTARINFQAYNDSYAATTRYPSTGGVSLAGMVELITTAGNGLVIGTGTLPRPIYFGTNNVLRLTIDSAGVINIGAGGVLQHNGTPILDASLNMTNLASLTVDKDQNATTAVSVYNENATSAAYAQLLLKAQTADFRIQAANDVTTATRYPIGGTGISLAGMTELLVNAGNGLIIGTSSLAKPIYFGTNNALRLTIGSTGIINIGASGVLQHNGNQILDSSGNINLAAGLTITASKTSGTCIQGTATGATYAGIRGINNDAGGYGVYGSSTSGDGVYGTSTAASKAGVSGINNTLGGFGVYGGSTSGYGGFFSSINIDASGILYHNTTPVLDASRNLVNIVKIDCQVGTQNIAVGYNALNALTTGTDNVAVGYNAGDNITTGVSNTAVGYNAGGSITIGISNTAFGSIALNALTTGSNNTAVGYNAGGSITTGTSNITLGSNAGSSITTGSNNTVIGVGADASSATVSNEFTLGNSSVTTLRCQQTTITALSDKRDKKNIEDLQLGLNFINFIKPRNFTWNTRDKSIVGKQDIGFIAQELEEAENEFGIGWYGLVYKSNPEKLEASPGKILPILVKAVQELSEKVDKLSK